MKKKKRMTITIDADICDALYEIPRRVSLSDTINLILRSVINDVLAGKTYDNEFSRWLDTQDGKDFKRCILDNLSPSPGGCGAIVTPHESAPACTGGSYCD